VQDPAAAAGEGLRAGGFAVEPDGQGVEDVADHGGVFQRADRAGGPLDPGDGLGLVMVQVACVLALVEFLAQGFPEDVGVGGAAQVPGDDRDDPGQALDDGDAGLGGRHGPGGGVNSRAWA
jgi:hypothetical protein